MDAPWPGPWLALGLALAGPWPGLGWPLAWPWLALGLALTLGCPQQDIRMNFEASAAALGFKETYTI